LNVNGKKLFEKVEIKKGAIITKTIILKITDNIISLKNNCEDASNECKHDLTQLISLKAIAMAEDSLSPVKQDPGFNTFTGEPCFDLDPLNCIFFEHQMSNVKDCPLMKKIPGNANVLIARCNYKCMAVN